MAKFSSTFDLGYDQWIAELWNSLDKSKKAAAAAADAGDGKFSSYGQFETFIRRLILPNNEYTISHLAIKTAWEGEEEEQQHASGTSSSLKEALQRDSYYATMIRGSCVKIPLTPDIWCPHDELQHTGEETQRFFEVMWEGLDEVAKKWHESINQQWNSRAGGYNGDDDDGDDDGASISSRSSRSTGYVNGVDVVTSTRRMKDIKRVMKEIWEESKSYRVSDAVHMTEKQILARLHRDGLLPLYGDAQFLNRKGMDQLHFCFLFRRHPMLRNQFAAAVGKRMTSEKIIHTGKNSIMEHHRTVQWSENEYICLAQLVRAQSSEIDKALRSFDKDGVLFVDYVRMLTQNMHTDAANAAGYNLRIAL